MNRKGRITFVARGESEKRILKMSLNWNMIVTFFESLIADRARGFGLSIGVDTYKGYRLRTASDRLSVHRSAVSWSAPSPLSSNSWALDNTKSSKIVLELSIKLFSLS